MYHITQQNIPKHILSITGLLLFLMYSFSCEHRKDENYTENIVDSLIILGRDSALANSSYAKDVLRRAMRLTMDSMKYYEAYEVYGNTFLTSSQFDSGIYIKHKALTFIQKQPQSKQKEKLLSSTYNGLGNIYSLRGYPDSALVFFKQALVSCIEKENTIDISINIADQYKQKGDYANSAFVLRRALLICDSLNLVQLKFPIHLALGEIYLNMKDYKNSDLYYSAAEKHYPYRKIMEQIVFCNNRGNYYYYIKNYRRAKYWFNQEQGLAEKSRNIYFANLSYLNLADIHLNLEQLDSCEYYINKTEKYFQSIRFEGALYYINTIKLGLAVKYHNYRLAHFLKNQTNSAIGVAPNLVSIRNNYMEKLSIQQHDYKSAYHYLKLNILLNDSVRSDIAKKRIEELDMRYKQDTILMRKEILIEQQNAQVKSLRISIYIWIIICTLGLLISSFIYFIIKRKHNIQRIKYMKQVTDLRMTNIRNRISPHFMFNVLNNEMNNLNEEKKKRLFALIHLLRKSLDMTEHVHIKLIDEIDFAKAYIELEKDRLGKDFIIEWNIDPNIDIDQVEIFPMTLQIPTENALKHGLQNLDRNKKLIISIQGEKGGVKITVKDNGHGYHPEIKNDSPGTKTGLKVLRQTIQILNLRNSDKIRFSISNINEVGQTGTITEIFIPYHFKFEYS